MNSKPLVFIAACLGIVYILLSILMDEGNAIGNISRYLVIGSCIYGLANPRGGMFWILFLAAYSDLLKRTMVFDWRFDQMDVFWVRSLVPMTLGCIFIGVLVRGFKDPFIYQRRHLMSLFLCFAGFLLAGISAIRSDGLTPGLMAMADGYSCMFLIFIIPCIFRTSDDVMGYAKFFLIVFVPVALYGMKQQFFGLSDFEIDYLKSGKTILIKQLEDVRPRPFSTLCDSSPYATTCAIMACLAIMLRGYYQRLGTYVWQFKSLALWGLYVLACITSMSRLPNLNWLLPFALLVPLRTGRGTFALYAALGATFVLVCVFAIELKGIIEQATLWALANFGNSAIGEQFSRFWTLGARLDGMDDLVHNPRMWTTFGYGPTTTAALIESGDVHSHDPISTSILTIGWLPTLIFLGIVALCIRAMHRAVLSLRGASAEFHAGVWMLATIFGLVVHNLFGGSVTSTTPVNFFFWFMAGAINTMLGHRLRTTAEERRTATPPAPPQHQHRIVHPFRPVGAFAHR